MQEAIGAEYGQPGRACRALNNLSLQHLGPEWAVLTHLLGSWFEAVSMPFAHPLNSRSSTTHGTKGSIAPARAEEHHHVSAILSTRHTLRSRWI